MEKTGRPSVPYARLAGEWEVLEHTADGRTTVAVRDDDSSGVAMSYPYAERDTDDDVNKIAVVHNRAGGYVLVTASLVSFDAVDRLVGDRPVEPTEIPREEFNDRSDGDLVRLLDGDSLVVVDPGTDDWYVGVVELFRDHDRVQEAWLESFPLLQSRLTAVQRVLADVDLRAVVSEVGERRSGDSGVRPP